MKLAQHDSFLHTADWLAERNLPVALTLIETLEPSGGPEAVIFPPTYARRSGEHPYAITNIRADLPAQEAAKQGLEANVCDLDSVGAQANRMEPAFKRAPLSSLVPQVFIRAGDMRVSLLDAGHRIADGAVRFSGFKDEITPAILALKDQTNADQLARIAPTSLLFGFWDSRDSQYKYPRVLSSTIRAANVAVLKRSAQFNPVFDPAELAKLGKLGVSAAELTADEAAEPEKKADANAKNPLSQQGLLAAPAVDTHGGVRVYGRIVRRTEINLVALRALAVAAGGAVDEEASLKLRRYLLGLALVAARAQAAYNLRQGCLLVGADNTPPVAQLVFPSGKREEFPWDFQAAFDFATAAAKDFGAFSETPAVREFDFQHAKVAEAIEGKEKAKAGKKAKPKIEITA
jgi:CRISPR-associated protein Csb1